MTRRAESLVLLDACWQLVEGRRGPVLFCGIFEHPRGVEVRCTCGPVLRRTQFADSLIEGRELANAWETEFLQLGWTPLPPELDG